MVEKNADKNAYMRSYYRNNRDKVLARVRRYQKVHGERKKLQKYGLTPEDFERMWEQQKGTCPICEHPLKRDKSTHVDHCHETGKVRGLLCVECNHLLGRAHDSQERLSNAIQYLSRSQNDQ